MIGWIKLHRSLKDWEWYDDHSTTRLLIHLLVSVNYEDKTWKGQEVKAGTLITSWESLASETGLSVKQVRTAMSKLEKSKEVTRYTTNKWQAVTLIKWDKLQCLDIKEGQTKGQSKGKQRATTKEREEEKKEIYIPELSEFLSFAIQECSNINQDDVKHKYKSWIMNEWKDGNDKPIKNWKTKLLNTIPHLRKIEIQKERIIFD
jgi:hypothetical protein